MSPQTFTRSVDGSSAAVASSAGSAKGLPFLVSGELFLRSTPELFHEKKQTSSSFSSTAKTTPSGDLGHRQRHAKRDSTVRSKATGNREPVAAALSHGGNNRYPSAGLLARVSADLRDLLLCHPDPYSSGPSSTDCGSCADPKPPPPQGQHHQQHASLTVQGSEAGERKTTVELVIQACEQRKLARVERIKQLEASKILAACSAAAQVSEVHQAADAFRRGCEEAKRALDARLGRLVLGYAAVVRTEIAEEDAQAAAGGEYCTREQERLELAARLASLATSAEYQTRGGVVLRRLPSAHPQHARCLRAATENVKAGFFSSTESPYDAVKVADIYKIENRFLLARFQRAAEANETCKVKGLFCHVPYDCLEHVVMFGVGAPDAGGDGDNDDSVADLISEHEWATGVAASPVDPLRAAKRSGGSVTRGWDSGARKNGRHGFHTHAAGNAAAAAAAASVGHHRGEPLPFPRAFSRHSTLEEERDYVVTRRPVTSSPRLGEHSLDTSDDVAADVSAGLTSTRTAAASRRRGDGRRDWEDASGLRLLALCRVMIGNTLVSSTPLSEFRASIESERGPPLSSEAAATAAVGGSRQGSLHLAGEPSSSPSASSVLPQPAPGQPDYDSVYFPREEEYLLLNQAFVLPEFLVVHRFVGGPPRPALPRTSTFPLSCNTSGNSYGADDGAASTTASKLGRDKISTPTDDTLAEARNAPPSPAVFDSPPGSTSAAETAASVVERMKAAMDRCHTQTGVWDPIKGGTARSYSGSGVGAEVHHEVEPPSLGLVVSRWKDGLVEGVCRDRGLKVSSSRDAKATRGRVSLTEEVHRRREQGSVRGSRDAVERAFELTFVGYRQDVARLREAELREIKSKLALSNARPGETDGHR